MAADGYLVTIGIEPTRAETGYGYIRAAEGLPQFAVGSAVPHVVAEFVEKPDAARAEEFVACGEYYWNAGIFVMKAAQVLEELDRAGGAEAQIADAARWIAAQPPRGATAPRRASGSRRWSRSRSTRRSWSAATGSRSFRRRSSGATSGRCWRSRDVAEPDECGNVRIGRGVDIDSSNTIVYSGDRLVATIGVEDLIIVDTTDATLVLPKERAQDVRQVVDALKAIGAPEVTQPKVSLRPWGMWQSLLENPSYQIKLIEVKPGCRLSLQKHHHRSEHWIVVSGTAMVTRDAERIEVHANEGIFLPRRLRAPAREHRQGAA